jgi:predicted nucleotidyltransferase
VFQSLLKRVAGELSRKAVPYMVIGGQAVLLYGEPRLTRDIDITLGIGIEELQRAKDVVEALGLQYLTPDIERFVRDTMVLPVSDEASGIRVDFIFSFSPYERQAIERAKDVALGDTAIRFAALEDVVIHKIVAGRPKDIDDIKAMLIKNPEYDKTYVRRWLEEFDASLEEGFLTKFDGLVKTLRTGS